MKIQRKYWQIKLHKLPMDVTMESCDIHHLLYCALPDTMCLFLTAVTVDLIQYNILSAQLLTLANHVRSTSIRLVLQSMNHAPF